MRRAGRGRRPTPAMLLTRLGPLPAKRAPTAPLRVGGLPRELPSTGRTGQGSSTSRRTLTWSEHTRKRTRGGGCYRHRCSGTRHRPSTGAGSSRKHRDHNRIPLFTGPRQAEEQPGEVLQRRLGPRDGAARNRRS